MKILNKLKKEKIIQSEILKWLKGNGYYSIKIISANHAGAPDILACINGKFVAIEVKRVGNKLTVLQNLNRKAIELSQGKFIIANSLEDVKQFMRIISNEFI